MISHNPCAWHCIWLFTTSKGQAAIQPEQPSSLEMICVVTCWKRRSWSSGFICTVFLRMNGMWMACAFFFSNFCVAKRQQTVMELPRRKGRSLKAPSIGRSVRFNLSWGALVGNHLNIWKSKATTSCQNLLFTCRSSWFSLCFLMRLLPAVS